MVIGDLLDELRINILRDRSDLIAGQPDDRLWSDDSLLRYIKDGEHTFARETLCLRDSTTPEYTRIVLRTGVQTYALHSTAIGVLSARYDTDTFDLQRSGHGIVSQAVPPELFTYDPTTAWNTQPGRPIAFYTDETLVFARSQQSTLSVYPLPSATEEGKILYLRTIRVPATVYSTSTLDIESEIPGAYQFDCLEWAAYRALRHNDADAGATTPSDKHKKAFDEAVVKAKRELKRTVFANMNVRYGQNGFTYVR